MKTKAKIIIIVVPLIYLSKYQVNLLVENQGFSVFLTRIILQFKR
jgi:hypothetical protein